MSYITKKVASSPPFIIPHSSGEAVLYSVLERANLTQYFNDFIAQGGDDVYQLCEAGEDEFLEIMALVGMASKPLHVRRLQKALQEWALFPEKFKASTRAIKNNPRNSALTIDVGRPQSNHSLLRSLITQPLGGSSPVQSHNHTRFDRKSTSPSSEASEPEINAAQNESSLYPPGSKLTELQVQAIEKTAAEYVKQLPFYAPKPLNTKKSIGREIEEAMCLPPENENRLELYRKYGAIYGRFDSKRNKNKHLNFHEMCVNEAAAQLCLHRPSLITRREDLFFQARQVVKEAGFQLTRVQYRSKEYPLSQATDDNLSPPAKIPKLDPEDVVEPATDNWKTPGEHYLPYYTSVALIQSALSLGKNENSSLVNSSAKVSPSLLPPQDEDDNGDVKMVLGGEGGMSLVEEGLRIARQYGLGALEEEIKNMKGEKDTCNNNEEVSV